MKKNFTNVSLYKETCKIIECENTVIKLIDGEKIKWKFTFTSIIRMEGN